MTKEKEDQEQRNLKTIKLFLIFLLVVAVFIAIYNYVKKQNRKNELLEELVGLNEKEMILRNLDSWQQRELKIVDDFNDNLPLYIRIILGICLITFDVIIFNISHHQPVSSFTEITYTLKEVATWNATIFSLFIFVSFITHGTIRNTEKTIETINDKLKDWIFKVYFQKEGNKRVTLIDNMDFNIKDLRILDERKKMIKLELKTLE